MSRRKQSAPCKVEGTNEGLDLSAKPAVGDFGKPLTALKVPINHSSHEKRTPNNKPKGINGVLMSLAAMAPRPLTVPGQNEQRFPLNFDDLLRKDGQIPSYVNNNNMLSIGSQVNNKPEFGLNQSNTLSSDIKRENTPSPVSTEDMDSDDMKKGRFSARLRAKNIMKTEEKMSESLVQTLQNCDQALNLIKIPASIATPKGGHVDGFYQQNSLANQRRKLSSDEELTCPICNKTFMSKYGLLTHVEIHGTPELKCVLCNLSFKSRTSFVAHQLVAHLEKSLPNQPVEQFLPAPAKRPRLEKGNAVTGFGELNMVEFSCKKFSLISEEICSSVKCRLTEKDLGHFFVCKACTKSFPTLQSLALHVEKFHQDEIDAESRPKIVELPDDVELTINKNETPEKEDSKKFMNILGLIPSKPNADTATALVPDSADRKNPIVGYGKQTELICTSPMLAYTNVPGWFRLNDSQKPVDITSIKQDLFNLNRRPSLKMKLVRKRSNEKKFEQANYFVDGNHKGNESSWSSATDGNNKVSEFKGTEDCVRDSSGNFTCKYCGDRFPSLSAVGGHRAASMCGIGVRSSVNGRKMYWCRLCNYASFEKSTIMRHQRTHTGVRPYSCKICTLAFTTKANCERHIRKRHSTEVETDTAIKDSVMCDYDLLKKARTGELNCQLPSSNNNTNTAVFSQDKFFSFQCRICKTSFSSRSNGTRHVMTKHGILNRKGANEMVMCVRVTGNAYAKLQLQSGFQSDGVANENNEDQSNQSFEPRDQSFVPRAICNNVVSKKRPLQEEMVAATDGGGRKLTPLAKLKAFHVAASELHSMLQTDFNLVLKAFDMEGGKEIIDENRRLSSALVTLFNSASTELLKRRISNSNKPPSRNFFNCPHCPALFVQADDLTTHVREIHKEGNEEEPPIQDFAQMFADGQLGDSSSPSPDDKISDADYHLVTSPRKQWKLSPLPLSLRNFAASSRGNNEQFVEEKGDSMDYDNDSELLDLSVKSSDQQKTDLASVEEIIDFSYKTNFTPIESNRNVSRGNSHPAKLIQTSSRMMSSGNGIRGKYQMVVFPSKAQNQTVPSGIGLNRMNKTSPLTWKFIPTNTIKENGEVKTMFIRKTIENNSNTSRNPRGTDNSHFHDVTQPSYSKHKSFPASEELVRAISKSNYRDDLPTMVPMSGSKLSSFQVMEEDQERRQPPSNRRHYKPRKCPKCDKSFPWASSLRRHIMTHTGLKPFMCSRCLMRFTTRSNLLRHAYRRHGLPRGSEDRNGLIVNLSLEDQEEFALQEASKIEDQEKKFGKAISGEDNVEGDDTERPFAADQTVKAIQSSDVNSPFSNKRYVCGLCSVPFANRSNLVRHLQRLHDITKDHPNFKDILVKIENAFTYRSRNASPSISPHPNKSFNPSPSPLNGADPEDPVEETEHGSPGRQVAIISPSLFTPPRKEAVVTPDRFPDKFKAFKCSVCMVGFTKRNNAARHLQHQHNISRKTTTVSDLIIRVEAPMSPIQNSSSPTDSRSPPPNNVTPTKAVEPPVNKIEVKQEMDVDVEHNSFEEPEKEAENSNLVIDNENLEINHEAIEEIEPTIQDVKTEQADDNIHNNETAPTTNEVTDEVSVTKEDKQENGNVEIALPWKARRRSASRKKLEEEESKRSPKLILKPSAKYRASKNFVCGVCRRTSKDVEELKKHLDEHNIPHPWHCTICGAPFTSKYNCQRHICRRHGSNETEPKYVEDIRHGPRYPKKKPRVFGRY